MYSFLLTGRKAVDKQEHFSRSFSSEGTLNALSCMTLPAAYREVESWIAMVPVSIKPERKPLKATKTKALYPYQSSGTESPTE